MSNTMTGAQRRNAKHAAIFEDAKPGARYDAMWDTGDPLSQEEQARRGAMIATMLGLHFREGRINTEWGTKTPLGLYRTIKRIVEDGK
jgi:hypothetical protein